MSKDDLKIPTGLSRKGRKVAKAILKVLKDHGATSGGGCTAFYSPKEWKDRGETYGLDAELVVVYDGGDLYDFFSYDSRAWNLKKKMDDALALAGCFHEPCTGWYSAIYPTS